MQLKMSSAKARPFRLGLNVLKADSLGLTGQNSSSMNQGDSIGKIGLVRVI